MRKSQIVIAVIQKKSLLPVTEKEILEKLSEHLSGHSQDLEEWNQEIEEPLAKAIIRNVGSGKSDVPIRLMIREVDVILQRVTS